MQENTASEQRYALIAASLASFVIPFSASALDLAMPRIAQEFHFRATTQTWVMTAYLLSSAVCLLPLGRAADLYGRRRIFLIGIVIFSIAAFLCGFAPSAGILIGLRALQGFGGAMIFGTGMAIVTSIFPASARGRVLGINVAAVYTGLSMGPVIGGILTQHAGWRSIFYLASALGVAAALAIGLRLKHEWRAEQPPRYDMTGALLYGLGIAAFMFGIAAIKSETDIPNVQIAARWAVPGGLLLVILFVLWERGRAHPLLDLAFFGNSVFAFSNIAALIHYCATFATGFLVSFYLQMVRGIDPQKAGFVILIQPVLMATLSPISGRLSDRIEPRILASIGMALTLAGLILFTLVRPDTPIPLIMVILAFQGVGFALFSSPNTNAVMSSVQRTQYGVGSAVIGTMRLLGQALSMVTVSVIFGIQLKGARITPQIAPGLMTSMRIAYATFAVFCAFGVAASLARGDIRSSNS